MDNNYNNQNMPNDPYSQGGMDPYNGGMGPQGSKGKAIASMVTGICSIIPGCCTIWLGIPLAIVAIILGYMSKKNNEDGKNMATAGIICGIVGLAVVVLNIVLVFVMKDQANNLADWLKENSSSALFIK